MSKSHLAAAKAAIFATVLISASVSAVAPTNPGFEDLPDLDTWTVADIGDYSGGGDVIRGDGQATEGNAYGRVSFYVDYAFGEHAYGPALQSAVFTAYAGEQLNIDWRVIPEGACNGNVGGGDVGMARGFLVDAGTDVVAQIIFDTGETCDDWWQNSIATAPAAGDYYLVLQIGSFDATGGGVIGAQLHVDNIYSINQPPDCTQAEAGPDMLWPPNHRFHEIAILGVTDPDGDAFEITVDSVFQDEPTNSWDDGDTCPDATGIGTATASVRAERVGGEWTDEGDGRVYRINFTATDVFGASCEGYVKVGVPHDKKVPAEDMGPLFDSTVCP
jgi:hypothetical protein